MRRERVVVAMSGGVDSSVSAYLLAQSGYEVIGAMLRFWEDEPCAEDRCCSPDAAYEARWVADQIGIPFYLLDSREIFRQEVIAPFTESYARGQTPNPCVSCNTNIKFDYLLEKARRLGADYLATGHYVQRCQNGNRVSWYRGADPAKDQTYFVWGTPRESVARILFPVGGMSKTQVRQIAAEAGLITAQKPESQNICFVGGGLRDFLKARLEQGPGPVYDLDGNLVGRHRGASFYTVGQRKGLELNSGFGEAYVARIIPEANTLVVGSREQCSTSTATVNEFNWLVDPDEVPGELWAQVRYRQKPVRAHLEGYRVHFNEPQFAVTPGQSLVLYAGDQLVGGGVIAAAETAPAELVG